MQVAEDDAIFSLAAEEGRVVVTADLDFGTLLALGHGTEPSVILLRRVAKLSPEQQVSLILANLPQLTEALDEGCIAIVEPTRIRIRSLPIGGAGPVS
jgi:predicted nuclease of predicted toxin-antitoxin system